MARKKSVFRSADLEQLKHLVYKRYNKKITRSVDCEHLSKAVAKVTKQALSPHSIRRFLGYLKSDFSTSINTLNILASYAGYDNWEAFRQDIPSIGFQALDLEQESELYLDFYKIEMKTEADMNYHNASRNIAFRILFNPRLLKNIESRLAENPVSQIFFFERFPFIDGLNTDYKKSLQLYLQKEGAEAQIFGNSLLFLSAFLCRRNKELKKYYDRISQIPINNTMHPFTIARYIGSIYLYKHVQSEDVSTCLTEINNWNKFFLQKRNINFWNYPYYQHMVAGYLNLTKNFKESFEIIKTQVLFIKPYEIEKGYEEALEVISEIARSSYSSFSYQTWFNSTKVFDSINPLFKKYYQIKCLCIYYSHLPPGKRREKVSEMVTELIDETGFTYFTNYLS